MSTSGAVGVFDSGVGGLSVLREIRRCLPNEHLVYVSDSGFGPYGDRTGDFIEERAHAIVRFLMTQHAKAVVVACNTATAVAVGALRAAYQLPIVAIEPAVKPAVAMTRSGVVGVLATTATLTSQKFRNLVDQHGRRARVLVQPCPGLAARVEAGDFAGTETRALLAGYVRPLIAEGADVLVLGCTHYTFLLPTIQHLVDASVSIVDPAPAVAQEVRRSLQRHGMLAPLQSGASEDFWTSGSPQQVSRVISRIWGMDVTVHPLPRC